MPVNDTAAGVTNIVAPVRDISNRTYPGLLVKDGKGNWVIADSDQPYAMQSVNFVEWTGVRGTTNTAMINGVPVTGVAYPESALIRPSPDSDLVALMNMSGFVFTAPRADGYYYENDGAVFNKIFFYGVKDAQLVTPPLSIIGEKNTSFYFHLEILDLDRNGLEDIVTYPLNLTARPNIYLNLGNGQFKYLDMTKFPVGPGANWGRDSRSKFLDANGDGIFDLLYFPFAASPQYQLPEPWQIHLGTTSRLGDFDNSSIVISNRGKGSLIATWAGDDLIKDTNPSLKPTTIDAGMGIDTAQYGGARDAYVLAQTAASSWTVKNNVLADLLVNVERLQFSDRKFALDLGIGGAAGHTVKIIGAAFGASSIQQRADWVGTGLNLFDAGMSVLAVSNLVVPILGLSNTAFVNTVYRNVVGVLPSTAERDYYVELLQGSGGSMTQAELLVLAANTGVNEQTISLVGLQQTGVEFI